MYGIAINTTRIDETVHHVVLDEAQIKALLVSAVAKAADVAVDGSAVKVRLFHISRRDTSTGGEYTATVSLTVDHAVSSVSLPTK